MVKRDGTTHGATVGRRGGSGGKRPGSRSAPSARRVRCGYVDTADGQLHYREVAGVEPAIVFLHQTASASSSFQSVMQRLRLPNRLLALDTPGFGSSFAPRGWPRNSCAKAIRSASAPSTNCCCN